MINTQRITFYSKTFSKGARTKFTKNNRFLIFQISHNILNILYYLK